MKDMFQISISKKKFWHKQGVGLTFVVLFGCGVVGTPLHHLLHVLGLHVDGHGSDDGAGGRGCVDSEADGACCGHANVQLLQRFRILKQETHFSIFAKENDEVCSCALSPSTLLISFLCSGFQN